MKYSTFVPIHKETALRAARIPPTTEVVGFLRGRSWATNYL